MICRIATAKNSDYTVSNEDVHNHIADLDSEVNEQGTCSPVSLFSNGCE